MFHFIENFFVNNAFITIGYGCFYIVKHLGIVGIIAFLFAHNFAAFKKAVDDHQGSNGALFWVAFDIITHLSHGEKDMLSVAFS